MKRFFLILTVMLSFQFVINLILCDDNSKATISAYQEGWSKSFTYEVMDAILRFRKDKERMPFSIAELRPSYLHDPEILISAGAKKEMGLQKIILSDVPESLDISGAIKIYTSVVDDSFFVILSPIFFGSEHIPVRLWQSDKETFNILSLSQVRKLTINYRVSL